MSSLKVSLRILFFAQGLAPYMQYYHIATVVSASTPEIALGQVLHPMQWVDFGFVRTCVNTHAPALPPLPDRVIGQFSYDAAGEDDTAVLTRLYHHFEDEVLDYMHVYNSKVDCLLVKAQQIQTQKWAVPAEVLEAFDIAILLRQAVSYRYRSGGWDLSGGHSIWIQQMIEMRELLR